MWEAPDKERTPQEHRTFFGGIKQAFENWPERHAFQPETAEALRSWLLIQVGHSDEMHVPDISPDDIKDWVTIARFTSGASKTLFRVKRQGSGLVFLRARSLSLKTVEDREQFHEIAQRVYACVHEITGVDVDRYVRGEPQAVAS